ncbi:siderophore-interacting protein [Photobacterium alginatilyticum]|uniref:siderophore-interacting protein n=1 Tax=Photobacterium alginatilyticum TaxID=1775171 RepID=UPI004068A157
MKPAVRLTQVADTIELSPHLKRIVLSGEGLIGFPTGKEGAHVKVILPSKGEEIPNLDIRGNSRPVMRSYTIREYNQDTNRLSLDFVINRHHGPATDWAANAKKGDYLGIAGPGPMKLTSFNAENYLLVGDLTSVNAINGYALTISNQSTINAIISVPTEEDIIPLDVGSNVSVHWVIDKEDEANSLSEAIMAIAGKLPANTDVFLGLEARNVRTLKGLLQEEVRIHRQNITATGYWKKGVDADRFGAQKKASPL